MAAGGEPLRIRQKLLTRVGCSRELQASLTKRVYIVVEDDRFSVIRNCADRAINGHPFKHRRIESRDVTLILFNQIIEWHEQPAQFLGTRGLRSEQTGWIRATKTGLDLGPVVGETRSFNRHVERRVHLLTQVDEALPLLPVALASEPGVHRNGTVGWATASTACTPSQRGEHPCEYKPSSDPALRALALSWHLPCLLHWIHRTVGTIAHDHEPHASRSLVSNFTASHVTLILYYLCYIVLRTVGLRHPLIPGPTGAAHGMTRWSAAHGTTRQPGHANSSAITSTAAREPRGAALNNSPSGSAPGANCSCTS